jgi:Na+-translocating ferredoxin:NAD+ oxidoreductase subunit D
MSSGETLVSGPFAHAASSVRRTMMTVVLALVPATLFNLYLFGWPAIFLFAVTIVSCLVLEAFALVLSGRWVWPALTDGSGLLTGWLLAMTLPPWAPWWTGVLGAVFAILLGKQAFGGLGQNLFNPAMVARVALLVSFPVAMTTWVEPHPLFSADAPGFARSLAIAFDSQLPDGATAATALGYVKTELSRGVPVSQSLGQLPDLMDMGLGLRAGSMGETSLVLILIGGLFLLYRRIVSWHIPVGMLGTLFLLGTLANLLNPDRFADGIFQISSGAAVLGAFFIATDYVTSPVTKIGQIVFGIGCGLMTWIIRSFAGYPEGVAFAVLLMNSLTPIIDQYSRPRRFGRDRHGEALSSQDEP